MPFTIRILDDSNIIELRYEGTVNIQEFIQAKAQVHSLLDQHGLMHALLYMQGVKLDMSTMEIYDFAATLRRPVGGRAALVGDYEDNNIRFFHTVATNKGIPIEFFTDYSEALAFLNE